MKFLVHKIDSTVYLLIRVEKKKKRKVKQEEQTKRKTPKYPLNP